MNSNKYPLYAIAILGGGAVALWAGLSPFFLLFLACPLMMFFMMRGGHGERDSTQHGQHGQHGSISSLQRTSTDPASASTTRNPDGSRLGS